MRKATTFVRSAIVLTALLSAGAMLATDVCFADATGRIARAPITIPAQRLESALQSLAKERDLQLIYRAETVAQLDTVGVSGELSSLEALEGLLKGTGLTFHHLNDSTITIVPKTGAPSAQVEHTSMDRVTLAQSSPTSGSPAEEAPRGKETADSQGVEEVVVTAQKRAERLQDVPVPVTAIETSSLVDSNRVRLQDYYTRIPGVSLTMLGDTAAPSVTIRGVTTGGYTTPTVGITVDDVPFTSSTNNGNGVVAPDFDPGELQRIEVLRGPQGTLYGASSLGGLMKYVTADPSPERFAARVQVGTASVENGDGLGFSVRGSVNLPMGERFAIRASGSTRRQPGYIDNIRTGQDGVNRTNSDSGRIAALWQPNDDFSLKLSALVQHTRRDGEDYVYRLPGYGDLEQGALIGTGVLDARLQAYSATLNANIGRSVLTSVSGYSVNETQVATDVTPTGTGAAVRSVFGSQWGASVPANAETRKFTQEVRLSIPLGERLQWLVGAFYADEKYPVSGAAYAIDPANGSVVGTALTIPLSESAFTERAAFTNLTIELTDRFDVQVGGRVSRTLFEADSVATTGPLGTALIPPDFDSKDSSFTYLVTPRFKISDDLMIYARAASGYRPGGPNSPFVVAAAGIARDYESDTTDNYEIGFKGTLLGRALYVDASAYYIDWQDIQVSLRNPVGSGVYVVNGGEATSRGFELSLESKPWRGMTLTAWGAWNNAELSAPFPPGSTVTAASGDRLPYSSRFSGNFSFDQSFPLMSTLTGFVGGAVSYVGDRRGRFFAGTAPRELFPAYTQVDLSAGVRAGGWSVTAFVNNLTDKRGIFRGGRDALSSVAYLYHYTQPRTIGLTVSKSFD